MEWPCASAIEVQTVRQKNNTAKRDFAKRKAAVKKVEPRSQLVVDNAGSVFDFRK